jgi:predicted ATP-grasp superfamily ATP-dependent carboligase
MGGPTLVVVGFAEAMAAPEVVWSLVDAGCRVVAFGRRGKAAAIARSRYAAVHEISPPEADAETAVAELRRLLEALRADGRHARLVLLALDDAAVWLCARADAPGWVFAGPSTPETLAVALDKRRQVAAASEAGIAVLPTLIARTSDDLRAPTIPFPLILRPADAVRVDGDRLRKGRNWICADEAELAAARTAWGGGGDLLVQPYVQGVGEGLFGLATEAGVVAWSAHRRLRMMNPHGSGSSACVSRTAHAALQAPVERMLAAAGWRGMFMVELLRTADGRIWFVEFNGRAWGSLALARRQGLEYPAWSVQLALGEPVGVAPSSRVREGLVCRNLGRELMHLLFVLRGRRSRAISEWPRFWSSLRAVLRPDSDGALYNWRRSDWRVFASDCYQTLAKNLSKSGSA